MSFFCERFSHALGCNCSVRFCCMLEQSCAIKHIKERTTTDTCESLTRRSSLISTDLFYIAWQHSTAIDELAREGHAPFTCLSSLL